MLSTLMLQERTVCREILLGASAAEKSVAALRGHLQDLLMQSGVV